MTPFATTLLSTLLAFGPPAGIRQCLRARIGQIASDAHGASAATGVPLAVLLAVGWTESHLGCARGSYGNWGAPIDRFYRGTAGRAIHAAGALAWGHRRCGSWDRALHHFRVGLCVPNRRAESRVSYPATATHRVARRLATALNVETPF